MASSSRTGFAPSCSWLLARTSRGEAAWGFPSQRQAVRGEEGQGLLRGRKGPARGLKCVRLILLPLLPYEGRGEGGRTRHPAVPRPLGPRPVPSIPHPIGCYLALPSLNFILSGNHPRSLEGYLTCSPKLCKTSSRGNQGALSLLSSHHCSHYHSLTISLFPHLCPHLPVSPGPQALSSSPSRVSSATVSSLLGPRPSRPAWPSSLAPPLRL